MLFSVILSKKQTQYIWNILNKGYQICISASKNAAFSKFEQMSLIFFIALIITLSNLDGLVPFASTVTASLLAPLYLAYICFVWLYLWGISNKFWSILTQFLPKGLPLLLVILFVFLEVVSNLARLISLSVRLFANMVAGHIMVKLITSAFTKILSGIFIVPLLTIVVLFTVIYSLEIFISVLQAFVFILLMNLYLKDFVVLHHN
jgi:F-type H+-transporting ATPase subunit a